MIGTVVFTAAVMIFPITSVIEGMVANPMVRIAAMHTIFNIVTTVLLLPLGNYLAKLAHVILPELPEPEVAEGVMHLEFLKPVSAGGKSGGLGVSAVVTDQLRNELNRMLDMARANVDDGFRAVLDRDVSKLDLVEEREDYLDFLNKEISGYISHLISIETNEADSAVVSGYFTICGNIERIGDHADNLAGYTKMLVNRDIGFSDAAKEEIQQMWDVCRKTLAALRNHEAGQVEWLSQVAQLEQQIDDMTEDFRRSQLARMRAGACNEEACILYSELLTDFERIGDHALNIAEELTKAQTAL